ncbi:branched-chain amino acid ABC transporter permease [Xanthobacter sp. TB0136]|uniref:branched-chain amino acid ABC transporter permease n=1 Tax=Xanthobacter sp. TB0136 TaxID=3459177 RepID=UPI004039CC19
MEGFVSAGLIGLSLGAQYALLALGFTLIFGILGVVNFAHGGFYLLGGYAAYCGVSMLGLPYPVAVILATLVTAALGYIFELLLLERVVEDHLATLILTLGLYLVMGTGVVLAFGPDAPLFQFPVQGVLRFGGIYLPLANLIVFVICFIALGLTWALIYRTNFGRSMRALSEDRDVAVALGIRARLMFPLAFALATGLAGMTGALVTPILSLTPHVGDPVLAASFLVVILGGLGSLGGATIAAFLVGLVEAYAAVYLGGSKGALLLFILVLIVLLVKPTGLFGRPIRGA